MPFFFMQYPEACSQLLCKSSSAFQHHCIPLYTCAIRFRCSNIPLNMRFEGNRPNCSKHTATRENHSACRLCQIRFLPFQTVSAQNSKGVLFDRNMISRHCIHQSVSACRLLLAPLFGQAAPGNLGMKSSLLNLPSRASPPPPTSPIALSPSIEPSHASALSSGLGPGRGPGSTGKVKQSSLRAFLSPGKVKEETVHQVDPQHLSLGASSAAAPSGKCATAMFSSGHNQPCFACWACCVCLLCCLVMLCLLDLTGNAGMKHVWQLQCFWF